MNILEELIARYPVLTPIRETIECAADMWIAAYRAGHKVLVAGNGGSCADAEHITGELLKGFLKRRPLDAAARERFAALWGDKAGTLASELQMGLPAINLGAAQALNSAFGNDVAPDSAIAQHLWAAGEAGDVFVAISTGGGAENLRRALMAAKVKNIGSILLTGNKRGVCEQYADCVIAVPERETFKVQELHLPVYHALCALTEETFFHE